MINVLFTFKLHFHTIYRKSIFSAGEKSGTQNGSARKDKNIGRAKPITARKIVAGIKCASLRRRENQRNDEKFVQNENCNGKQSNFCIPRFPIFALRLL
jgi:hypothetical protein